MNYYYVTRNNFIQIPLLEFNDRIVVIQYKRKKIINVVVINGLIFEEIDCNSYEFLYLRNLRTIRQRCRHLHDSLNVISLRYNQHKNNFDVLINLKRLYLYYPEYIDFNHNNHNIQNKKKKNCSIIIYIYYIIYICIMFYLFFLTLIN